MTGVVAFLAVAAGACAQAVAGIGFALVCAPFLVAAEGSHQGVRLSILLSAVLNAFMVLHARRDVRVGDAGLLFLPAAVASGLTALVVRRLPERTLALIAGFVIVGAVAALASGLRVARARGRGGALVAGAVSGSMNVVSGVGGPPVALYAVNAGWPARTSRATLQAYFLAINVVALVGLGLPRVPPALFVAMALGWAVGAVLDRRVPDRYATAAILSISAIGGVVTLIRAAT